ncbi:hypothetical protein AVEN_265240-1 [Araneus ventricosus]|uniref:Uncharacterized protein n=1 Tax=Araneus ventricosus TaxID=182803 RepID=A0A4Y2S2E2_ARAVE|nr:hypothetical protein AVEN_265240-1 [Araneus ventricosus]
MLIFMLLLWWLKKDASASTEEIDFASNKAYTENINLNMNNPQDGILASHPFLEIIENLGAHGYEFDPFKTKTTSQLGNHFLGIKEPDDALNIGETYPHMLPTNPFFQVCIRNPFVDSSLHFPAVFEDEFTNITFPPRKNYSYCKEWIEKHRRDYIKTVRSFSRY